MTVSAKAFTATTDAQSVWTNDGNVIDQSAGAPDDTTSATTTTTRSSTSNLLVIDTPQTAPTGVIAAISLRLKASTSSNLISFKAVVKLSGTQIATTGNLTIASGTKTWRMTLPETTAGEWTAADYANITVELSKEGGTGTLTIYDCSLIVWTHLYKWPMIMKTETNLPSTGTNGLFPFASTDGTWLTNMDNRQAVCPCPLTIRRLDVTLDATPGGTGSETFAYEGYANPQGTPYEYIGSGATLLYRLATDTMAGSDAVGNNDGKDALGFEAGDAFALVRRTSITGGNASNAQLVNAYVYADTFPLFALTLATVGASATNYLALIDGGTSTTSTTRYGVIPVKGVISNLYVKNITGALSSGTYTVTLVVNGTPTSLVAVNDSTHIVGSDTTHSVTVNPGDQVQWKIVGASASTASRLAVSACFEGDSGLGHTGKGILMSADSTAQTTTTSYNVFNGASSWNTAGEAATGGHIDITDFYMQIGPTGVGGSRTGVLQVNSGAGFVDTVYTQTISGVGVTDPAGAVSDHLFIDETWGVALKQSVASTPNNGAVRISLAYKVPAWSQSITDDIGMTDSHDQEQGLHQAPSDPLGIEDDEPVDSGTTTSGNTSSTLHDTGKSWTTNQYAGFWVRLETGADAGDVKQIASNTTTVLTVSPNFTNTPTSGGGEKYSISETEFGVYYVLGNTAPVDYHNFVDDDLGLTDFPGSHYKLEDALGMTDFGIAVRSGKIGEDIGLDDHIIVAKNGVVLTHKPKVMIY